MPRKILFVSFLLFLASAIFFLILFSKKEVCGQTNTESPCCPCAPTTANFKIPDGSYGYVNSNRERLLNRQIDNSGNSMLVVANTKTSNQNSCCQYQKKTISLPEVNSKIAPLIKAILSEHTDNYMEFAEYFGVSIGTKNYYFREDNESINNIGSTEADTKIPEICGRYAMVYSFPTDSNLREIANGGTDLWRNFNGKWKSIMNVEEGTNPNIYPLIMTKAEISCLKIKE